MMKKTSVVAAVALAFASATAFGVPAFADGIRDKQWHLSYLKVLQAQRRSTGKGVVVAVLDSGVSKHSDLSGSLLAGTDLVGSDGNGQDDVEGHGTAVAGLIAAHGKNGNGAWGIAPDAKILPVRVFRTGDKSAELASGIDYAVSQGAGVINMSISVSATPELLASVNKATNAGVVLVAGVGNRPSSVSVTPPASLPGVLGVGAIGRSGELGKISVTGKSVDIAAPGEDIESTYKRGDYLKNGNGTSYSSAIVAGAAALLRSKFPQMSAADVVERLESTAVDKGAPGVDNEYGHGVLDIVAALNGDGSATTEPSATAATPNTNPSSRTPVAAEPASSSKGSSSALFIGGVVLVVLLGGVVAFFALRSRKGQATR
ncbi:type VII secretion-associated serine protease mycosin [Actinoplanes sp. TFC3]|uniref:type VII secretion-associated serine protease mycosin n=1 Tax=Actinoplanes sp. TFC3 TaxID=1710355 RepID=UPI0009E7862E|nr:type VII secretion-associated serine protease mycosin [Actinoplanes sp. TFC3]